MTIQGNESMTVQEIENMTVQGNKSMTVQENENMNVQVNKNESTIGAHTELEITASHWPFSEQLTEQLAASSKLLGQNGQAIIMSHNWVCRAYTCRWGQTQVQPVFNVNGSL